MNDVSRLHPVLLLSLLLLSLLSCDFASLAVTAMAPTPAAPPTTGSLALGKRTKSSGCISANALPDPACTPGAVFPDATVEQICTPGYSSSVRDVPQSVKEEVYAEYGIASHEPGQYEVDHLIPLGIGGSNDIANLWPEPADPAPGFHEKDRLENYLHDELCSGRLPLREAQASVARDWLSLYRAIP